MLRFALLAISAVVATAQIQGHLHLYEQVFDALDSNGDGQITMSEFDAAAPGLDLNGDGQVTKQEFITVWESVTLNALNPEENRHAAQLLFEEVDGGTGVLPMTDHDRLFDVFEGPDNDGSISKEEFLQEWHRIHPNHGTHHTTMAA